MEGKKSGPSRLTQVDWTNEDYRRSVIASLVQSVYTIERDRLENREGSQALARPWWEFFNFKIIHLLKDGDGDGDDDSIIGAIYELTSNNNLSTAESPHRVIAFRGTLFKRKTFKKDLRDDFSIIRKRLNRSPRYKIAMEAVRYTVDSVGRDKVWIAGHSLGSAIALLVGKEMANNGVFLKSFLFNPPFSADPFESNKNKKVKRGLQKAACVFRAGLAPVMKKKTKPDPSLRLSQWVPRLYVNPYDPICNKYIGYFEQRKRMESMGIGGTKRVVTQHSLLGRKCSKPIHPIPSADLIINRSSSRCFIKAHEIRQWWRSDLVLEFKPYTDKIKKITVMTEDAVRDITRFQEYNISHRVRQETENQIHVMLPRYVGVATPDDRIFPYLEMAGFHNVSSLRFRNINHALVNVLLKSWRPETNTFSLPYGEYTITLEDIALLTGLSTEGVPILGRKFGWTLNGAPATSSELLQELLGISPVEAAHSIRGLSINLCWLVHQFQTIPHGADDYTLRCHARAYILQLLGEFIFGLNTTRNIHIYYLQLLENLHVARGYNWGSACLAFLYQYLCRSSMLDNHTIGGFIWLIDAWAYLRIPSLYSHFPRYEPTFLKATRWAMLKDHRDQIMTSEDSIILPNDRYDYGEGYVPHLSPQRQFFVGSGSGGGGYTHNRPFIGGHTYPDAVMFDPYFLDQTSPRLPWTNPLVPSHQGGQYDLFRTGPPFSPMGIKVPPLQFQFLPGNFQQKQIADTHVQSGDQLRFMTSYQQFVPSYDWQYVPTHGRQGEPVIPVVWHTSHHVDPQGMLYGSPNPMSMVGTCPEPPPSVYEHCCRVYHPPCHMLGCRLMTPHYH